MISPAGGEGPRRFARPFIGLWFAVVLAVLVWAPLRERWPLPALLLAGGVLVSLGLPSLIVLWVRFRRRHH